MSDSDGNVSQLEAYLLQLPENDAPDQSSPNRPSASHIKEEAPPAPSPFEDYLLYPFHWTGESLGHSPVNIHTSSQQPKTNIDRSALIDQFPMIQTPQLEPPIPPKVAETDKSGTRKKRFKQLRRAMSLTHIRHKPTPPDTAPPTPTVSKQVPSSGDVKNIGGLAHWQLPDPTAAPASLDGSLIIWPSGLMQNPGSPRGSYEPPLGQLSPPSSIPSESDILPRDSLIALGVGRSSPTPSASPNASPAQSPRALYPPTLYDTINLSDPSVLEKTAGGKVVAGTVEGLVAYVTSPDCLDYEVLSDFFMMFRKFMDPSRLLGLLCARFEWGLINGVVVKPPDNEGMVRVRTFAALRHWLLNYFADDFAPSPSLRSQFVNSINAFGRDKRVKASTRDTKIITELKRCWRKVLTIYKDHQARGNASANVGDDLTPGDDNMHLRISHGRDTRIRNRVPSLIYRATREREEKLLGVGTSQSHPDLRRRFIEAGNPETDYSNHIPLGKGHARIHSTSTTHTRPGSQFQHRRNASAETHIIYSKNSSPGLYQSLARGDGREEWPSVIVRADLLVKSPKSGSITPSWYRKKKLFRSNRRKITAEGDVRHTAKPPTHLSCVGQLSDDEGEDSRWTRKIIPSLSTSEPARDRVDFLAAGMWASFISAASAESQVSIPRAEELGEALVQGHIQSMKVGDTSDLAVATSLDKGKAVDRGMDSDLVDMAIASSESQVYQTTLSMSEIERQLGFTIPPFIPLPATPDSFRRISSDIRISGNQSSSVPTPPLMNSPEPTARTLRRRPGGILRQAETVEPLRPRPTTLASVTSSMSSFSLAPADNPANLAAPTVSTESRSLRSLLEIPHENRRSQSPTHRLSGLAMDFSRFQMPEDIESSDDENCDPADAVKKTLLKLEGKYVRKGRQRSSSQFDGDLFEIAFGTSDLRDESFPNGSVRTDSPPESIMVEKDEETRWRKRHKHVVDGQECDTPTRHGPFTPSSLFEFLDSSANMDPASEYQHDIEETRDICLPLPTVESALEELERDRREALGPRIPTVAPPKPPESYHRSLASHLPFILQYDSTLLARQFTLIEKDICAEIDWTELIEPTWLERNAEMVDVRDWKNFVLRDGGDRGLDTVMARFNLMAGWTTSEVILTQSLAERSRVLSKFIHIAAACQRLHNYATLTQIVMGLQSNHVSALTKTWEDLNAEDIKLWHDLQDLVDSRKNWAKMRNEMDNASVSPREKGQGCIPFVGIFMSDLVHITSRPLSPGMIDFEGLRLRASIIKKTLRLIELAEEYDFQPEAGVAERCLWITAFNESMLRRVAAGLE